MQLRTEIKSQNNQNTSRLLTHSCLVTIWETFIFPDSEKFPLVVLGIPSAFHHFLVEAFEFFRNLREKIKKGNAYGTEELFDCDGPLPFEILKEGNFQLNVKSNPWFHWFALLCSVIGPEKLASISQPIRYKTKTNHDLVARVFPRFRQFACFCFEFSSALQGYVFSFHLIGLCN